MAKNRKNVTETQATEVAVAKAQATALTPEQEQTKQAMADRFHKAMENVEGSMWYFTAEVYHMVKSEEFKELFGGYREFAKFVGCSPATISNSVKVYERKLWVEQQGATLELSVSQLAEFGKIAVDDTEDFIEKESVTKEDTLKQIREKAKHYTKGDEAKAQATEEQAEETEEQAEEEKLVGMLISYNGTEYQILSEDVIARIMAILNEEE